MSKASKKTSREELAALRRAEAEAAQRKQRFLNIGIAVLVVAVVIGIFVAVQSSRNSGPSTAALPSGVAAKGDGAPFGKGPVTVDLWEDFQCPVCKQFESVNGDLLKKYVANGDITLVVHPLSFLDSPQKLSNTSSVRAASAFGCAVDAGKGLEFHSKLYQAQPPENPGTEAWTDAQLVQYGNDVGITGDTWSSCVNDQTYAGWAQQVEGTMAAQGITGTPTVFVDGKNLWPNPTSDLSPFLQSSDALKSALDEAVKNANG